MRYGRRTELIEGADPAPDREHHIGLTIDYRLHADTGVSEDAFGEGVVSEIALFPNFERLETLDIGAT